MKEYKITIWQWQTPVYEKLVWFRDSGDAQNYADGIYEGISLYEEVTGCELTCIKDV